jgi:pimeloyl-ACP methyl ester carboxylesterase
LGKLPVLFIPGTLCTGAIFERQVKALAELAPQVVVVQPGLEDSMSKMADAAIDAILPHSAAAVIGFSMGGMIAMEIARKAPQLIGKLALLNTNFHADSASNRAARLLHLQQARAEGMERVIRQHYLQRYLHQPSPATGQLIIDMACELGPDCFDAQIRAHASRPDSSTTLQGITCPTLVLGAEQDELCAPAVQEQMHRMISGSTLVMLRDCGHFSMLEKPAEVSRALRDWYLRDKNRQCS